MAKPVDPGDAKKGRWLAEWRARYPEAHGFELEWDEELGVPVPTVRKGAVAKCGIILRGSRVGAACQNIAGARTSHPGVGRCWRHDTRVERAAGAWMMAHRISTILEISPWEALLLCVKRAATWAAFYDAKLGEVTNDDDLLPNGAAYPWVEGAERANDKLARWSKAAIDAGVAAILVQRAQTEGAEIVQVLNRALGLLGFDEETEQRVRAALRQALEMEATASVTASVTTSSDEVDGDVVD